MKHKMGLAAFSLQDKDIVTRKKYLDNSGNTYTYVWTDDATILQAHSSRTFPTSSKPYTGTSNYFYYIVNGSATVVANNENTYPNADVPNNSWSQSVNIPSGEYVLYSKAPEITCSVLQKHTLALGDIMYSSGAISSSYNASLGTPVALIFYLGTTAYDKSVSSNLTHGYAMSLKYAGGVFTSPTVWCTGTWQTTIATDGLLTPRSGTGLAKGGCDIITTGISGDAQEAYRINAIRNDMEGLKHCKYAKAKSSTAMTAILKAESHQSYAPVPTSRTTTIAGSITMYSPYTSGWYLPSIGQCYQWMNTCSTIITGSEAVAYRILGNATGVTGGNDFTKDFSITKGASMPSISEGTASEKVCKEITAFLNGKGLSGLYSYLHPTAGTKHFWWWTSTENFTDHMFVFNCDGTNIYMDGRNEYAPKNKDNSTTYGVMPVLAF